MPRPPMCSTRPPITSKTGMHVATSTSVPPTMIDSVPSWAPTSPPLTGASTTWTPAGASLSARAVMACGEMVLTTTRMSPDCSACAKPSSKTLSSSWTSGRTDKTMRASIARRSCAIEAPAEWARSAGPSLRFHAWTRNPALAALMLTGRPMAPRPITATSNRCSLTGDSPQAAPDRRCRPRQRGGRQRYLPAAGSMRAGLRVPLHPELC